MGNDKYEFEYSVAIRSVGENEFLKKTLISLEQQTVPPKEIVIAIPSGIDPWATGVATVRFVASARGAVSQRAAGIKEAANDIVLLLDDDIVLERTAVETMVRAMIDHKADCIVPFWRGSWPRKYWTRVFSAWWGMSIPRSTGGITYAAGGGYYYPLREPDGIPWETTGGAGAVILINRIFATEHNVFGDLELQKIGPYALRDDGAFIVDLVDKGGRSLMVGGVSFEHLGGTTRIADDRLYMAFKAEMYNHFLFWKRYIWPRYSNTLKRRFYACCSVTWYLTGVVVLAGMTALRARSLQPVRGICAGLHMMAYRGGQK